MDMAYIARRPCGCLVMAVVDNPAHKRDAAKEVAAMIRKGYSIDRVTCEAVRKGPWECPVCHPVKAKP